MTRLLLITIASLLLLSACSAEKVEVDKLYLAEENISIDTAGLDFVDQDVYKYYTNHLTSSDGTITVDEQGFIKIVYQTTNVEGYNDSVQLMIDELQPVYAEAEQFDYTSEQVRFRNATCFQNELKVQAGDYINHSKYLICPNDTGVVSVEYNKSIFEEHPLDETYDIITNSVY